MLFRLDFQSAVPIYRQIRDQVVLAVAQGELTPGERLPTTRALAEDAGVNVMTVSKAYQMLKQEGFIVSDRRSGARVRERGPQDGTLTRESREQLRVLAAEAKARGMSRADFLGMCGAFFGEE